MRVAVLCGGRSSEHEVSLQSGASVRDGVAAGEFDAWPDRVARIDHDLVAFRQPA